jgi:hypothetical protein
MGNDGAPATYLEGGDDLDTGRVPDVRDATSRYYGVETLQEGVYFEVDGRVGHYVLQGSRETLCRTRAGVLYRLMSSWAFVPATERCAACAPLVTERGSRRYGWVEKGDPPLGELWRRSRAEEQRQLKAGGRPKRWLPRRPVGTTYSDPPFVLAVVDEYGADRVLNDVYGRAGRGTKWHRIDQVERHHQQPHILSLGRSYLFPCGQGADEYARERTTHRYFETEPVFVGIPPAGDVCRSCSDSDARHGRDIPAGIDTPRH